MEDKWETIRRWFSDERYPSEIQLPKINETLTKYEQKYEQKSEPVSEQKKELMFAPVADSEQAVASPQSTTIYKEIKNKDVKRKAKKKSTTRLKIDLDNPCASCPARDTKGDRFVDGEGT